MDLPNGKQKGHPANDIDTKFPEREVNYTFWLIFSVFICVFGNSFLYGYNIGVVNSPASIIKAFYAQVNYARDGQETYYKPSTGGLYFKNPPNNTVVNTNITTTAPVYVVINTTGSSNSSNSTIEANLAISKKGIDDDNHLELLWSITVAIFVLFGMVGSFSSGKLADYFGRKRGMIVITFLMFLAALFGGIPIIAKSPECLIISRAIVGLHCGLNTSLASLYLAEISPKKIRGAIGTCHQLFITIGILWSMVLGLPKLLGTWYGWPILFAFNAVPALTCLLLMPICPESPRYLLIKKNDEDGARKALKRLLGYDDVENELEEMRVEARKASSVQSFSLKQLLTTPELKLPIIIATVLQIAQQLSGINAAMSYSRFIFEQANVEDCAIPYVVVAQGAINVLATIVAVPLIEKLGRRPLLIWPMCVMVVSFIVLTVCLNLLQSPDMAAQKSTLAIICIAAILFYVIGFAAGLGPIPFIVVGEIFRQEPRAAAMGFSIAWNWICNFILSLTFRFIQKAIRGYTYLIFVVILVAAITFIFFFVPETKNRTFDDIAESISFGRTNRRKAPFREEDQEMQPMRTEKA